MQGAVYPKPFLESNDVAVDTLYGAVAAFSVFFGFRSGTLTAFLLFDFGFVFIGGLLPLFVPVFLATRFSRNSSQPKFHIASYFLFDDIKQKVGDAIRRRSGKWPNFEAT
jgi:hypothetical protein